MVPTVAWEDGAVVMIDQRRLPGEEVFLRCHDHLEVASAIREMAIRGAPAIGVAAAYGLALGARNTGSEGDGAARGVGGDLRGARGDAPHRGQPVLGDSPHARVLRPPTRPRARAALRDALLAEAGRIEAEDLESCRRLGDLGAGLLPPQARVLTHCNAGALATAGYGTALGVIRSAARIGKLDAVFADETRPFLQGARLTAWELLRDGIPVTLLADNVAGFLMARGEINAVVVGADRIAANGDVANKIGTYTVAVLAREHKIPFYVAAPISTFDMATPDGRSIPIEERPVDEVTHFAGRRVAPEGVLGAQPRLRRDAGALRDGDRLRTRHRAARPSRRACERWSATRAACTPRVALVLGIETSCDETAAAVVDDARRVLSNVVASQIAIHAPYGGVVPELASRHHLEAIGPVLEQALREAGVGFAQLDAVAVTHGPGLVGSLLVGVQAAKAIALVHRKPLVPRAPRGGPRPGGLPRSRRDPAARGRAGRLGRAHEPLRACPSRACTGCSAGRATTRPARRSTRSRSCSGLGYPGGPAIERLAEGADDQAVDFTIARLKDGSANFSFSGIKTAVLLHARREGDRPGHRRRRGPRQVRDLVASFQRAVVASLRARPRCARPASSTRGASS